MITKHDELLCHQIASTFDHVSDSGGTWRENLWCTAHDISGKIHIATILGVSRNRNIIDGAGLLTIDGKTQYNIRASRELRPRIDEVKVGPISYEVIDGLKKVCWAMGENEYGVSWEIEFDGRMPPLEEKPQYARSRGRLLENICRYCQSGRPRGWVKVEGKTHNVEPENWRAYRDHSWGLRHLPTINMEHGMQPPELSNKTLGNWNIFQFDTWCLSAQLREHIGGGEYFTGRLAYAYGDSRPPLELIGVEHDFRFFPDTRRLNRALKNSPLLRVFLPVVDFSEAT
jgi:hypothetical protein